MNTRSKLLTKITTRDVSLFDSVVETQKASSKNKIMENVITRGVKSNQTNKTRSNLNLKKINLNTSNTSEADISPRYPKITQKDLKFGGGVMNTKIHGSSTNVGGKSVERGQINPNVNAIPITPTININKSKTNTINSMIDKFKKLLHIGIEKPVCFLNKDAINNQALIDYEKHNLEKALKINSFSEEIEMLAIELNSLKNLNTNSPCPTPSNKEEEHNIDEVGSVIKLSSDRRKELYDGLFHAMKENLEEIIYISTQLKPHKNTSSLFNNPNNHSTNIINHNTTNNNIFKTTSDNSININLNLNIGELKIKKINSNMISRKASKIEEGDDKVRSNNAVIINNDDFEEEQIYSSDSSDDASFESIDEELSGTVHLPISQVKRVMIHRTGTKSKLQLGLNDNNFSRQNTKRQILTCKKEPQMTKFSDNKNIERINTSLFGEGHKNKQKTHNPRKSERQLMLLEDSSVFIQAKNYLVETQTKKK
jgi:hypothetical protein